jgi:hypothetical protein
MAQIEHADNLARFTNPAYRLVTHLRSAVSLID